MKIELREQVELVDGKKTKNVEMREPNRKDFKEAQKINNVVEQEDFMLTRLCGISQESLDSMPICDSRKLTEALEEMGATNYSPKS